MKTFLPVNVLDAAKERIKTTFDLFDQITVSFSGGKDSTVLLHLVMEEAKKRNRTVVVLFIDWEAQYKLTIEHVKDCFEVYKRNVIPYWIALPLRTTNACSQFEPEWICWQPEKKHLWVRDFNDLPDFAITNWNHFPFYYYPMTFEEFVPAFNSFIAGSVKTASFVGIRTQESLNRWRSITSTKKDRFNDLPWTTVEGNSVNAYPIYDWKASDDFIYFANSGKPYNKIYDLMYRAGLTVNQMRICEPYGDEQRRGLWLYSVLEPETWGKVVARVAGANTGNLYANESGIVLGNNRFNKPDGHTWESFAKLLLNTMPEKTSIHYRNKIAVWLKWYEVHGFEIKDELEDDTGSNDKPSWRRVCKVLLKNDYWCKGLCFSPTKTSAYENYLKLMRKRRDEWNLI